MEAYKITLKPVSLNVRGRIFKKGFTIVLVPEHPDFMFFKRNGCFKLEAIDIPPEQAIRAGAKSEPDPGLDDHRPEGLVDLGLDEATLKSLEENDITEIIQLLEYDSIEKLTALKGVGPKRAEMILAAIGEK